MIKEAMEFLLGLKRPTLETVDGRTYSTQKLDLVRKPIASAMEIANLGGIVDYVRSKLDGSRITEKNVMIHVLSPTEVRLVSALNELEDRATFLKASFEDFEFEFGRYMPLENMIVSLQCAFTAQGDRDQLMVDLSQVADIREDVMTDSGITQGITRKAGVILKENGILKNPVTLAPRRSFPDIEQVDTQFVVRVKKDQTYGIQVALFEADGGSWKATALDRITEFFEAQLEGFPVIS
jgi:hypothetical protein